MAKKKFTRELILDKAFEIASDIGLSKLSMRGLAKELGSSVMPIYDEFDSKDQLIESLSNYMQKLSFEEMNFTNFTSRHLVILRYGLMFPDMFFDLITVNRNIDFDPEYINNLRRIMRSDKRMSELKNNDLERINITVELFIMGIIYLESVDRNLTIIKQKQLEEVLIEYIDIIVEGYSKR